MGTTGILFNFNSTLVRLRVGGGIVLSAHGTAFQFHIGAIKSSITLRCLVTLSGFQFHIGAIKSSSCHRTCRKQCNFNSTLVRLRVTVSAGGVTGSVFQFHIGAIKSGKDYTGTGTSTPISIPHWCD